MEQILETGSGMWAPIAWVVAFITALVIGWLIRNLGESGCQQGTEQTQVFISGEDEKIFAEKDVHIVGGNLYWGISKCSKSTTIKSPPCTLASLATTCSGCLPLS